MPTEKKSPDWWVTANLRNTPERAAAVNQLIKMHTYKRPAGCKTERKFIKDFIRDLPGVHQDHGGNLFGRIGSTPVLFSSHTDTVHESKGFQTVGFLVKELGIAMEDKSGSSCLGADDTVGVWHMIQMWNAKVPGLYIWHREEEIGRKGSKWIAENNKELLAGIKMAIAFDRRADDSIITYQSGDRCCSDTFADELAKLLNAKHGFKYVKDKTGSFTDTYTYTDLIGECTNISVGYTGAHSKWEMLDLEHAMNLRDILCSPEFSIGLAAITIERKPGEKEVSQYSRYTQYTHGQARDIYDEWGFGGADGYYGQPYGTHFQGGHGHGHYHDFHTIHRGGDEQHPNTKPVVLLDKDGKPIVVDGKQLTLPNTTNSEPRTIILPKTEIDDIVGNAVVPPEDEDAADEKDLGVMTKLVERNHQAIMEILDQVVYDAPDAVAQLLQDHALDAKDLMDEIMNLNGGQCNC